MEWRRRNTGLGLTQGQWQRPGFAL
jgi:hypothetical protein